MKNRATIRMGAPYFDVTLRDAGGSPVHFDLRAMDKRQRSTFIKEFVKAFREAQPA